MAPQKLRPLGNGQVTSLSSAVGLNATLAIPAAADRVWLQAEGQDIRFRDDGTSPTAGGVGLLLAAGSEGVVYVGDISALRFIEEVAGAKLNFAYYTDSFVGS